MTTIGLEDADIRLNIENVFIDDSIKIIECKTCKNTRIVNNLSGTTSCSDCKYEYEAEIHRVIKAKIFNQGAKAMYEAFKKALVEHDNKVIERSAKVCDEQAHEPEYYEGALYCAEEIRALKGK
jgi:Zn-finger protein